MSESSINVQRVVVPEIKPDSKLEKAVGLAQPAPGASGVSPAPGTAVSVGPSPAQMALAKYAIGMCDVAMAAGAGMFTRGRVSMEAQLSDEEKTALIAAWAPLLTPTSPMTLAMVTTGAIVSQKFITVWRLNRERKEQENGERTDGEPGAGNGSDGTGPEIEGSESGASVNGERIRATE